MTSYTVYVRVAVVVEADDVAEALAVAERWWVEDGAAAAESWSIERDDVAATPAGA